MAQYIDKFAVMAEIESYINSFCDRNGHLEDIETNGLTYETLCDLKNSIDTLEVKEVDFEKELDEWMKYGPHTNYPWCTIPDAIRITAEHFFELGLNAKGG